MELGKLNGADNFAGVVNKTMGKPEGGIEVLGQDEWDFCIGINLTGVIQWAGIPQFADDGGSIVSAANTLGLIGRQYGVAYAASKHGCIGLTRSVAKEVGVKNIRVNCLAPYVKTDSIPLLYH